MIVIVTILAVGGVVMAGYAVATGVVAVQSKGWQYAIFTR